MFGFFYTVFVLICKSILNIKENIYSFKDKNEAIKNNNIIYHDIYGNTFLTSNNHPANLFGIDIRTGDKGIKDVYTGELVYNSSEQIRIKEKKQKENLIEKNKEYNEIQRQNAIDNNKYYYNGLDVYCKQVSNENKYWFSKPIKKRVSDDLNIVVQYKTIYDEKNIFILDILDSKQNDIEKIKQYNLSVINDKKGTMKLLGYSRDDLLNYAKEIGAIY